MNRSELTRWAAVFLGGASGASARKLVGDLSNALFGSAFPWGTFLVNLSGSFLLGGVLGLLTNRISASPLWRLGIAVGFIGAFTTFSSFELDTLKLIQAGHYSIAMAYDLGSIGGGFLSVWLGYGLGSRA